MMGLNHRSLPVPSNEHDADDADHVTGSGDFTIDDGGDHGDDGAGGDGIWTTRSANGGASTPRLPIDSDGVHEPLSSINTNGRVGSSSCIPAVPVPTNKSSYCVRCLKCCFTIIQFINSFAVMILVGLVVFLFFQVQYLNVTLKSQQTELSSLEARLQNQTTTQIQILTEKVDQEQNLTLYQMAGTFTLLASLLTMFHMSSHIRNFYQPLIQRKIVAILWLSPIYAVTSFFSLVFPSADGTLRVWTALVLC